MPIYEYRCPDCGLLLEQLGKITEKPIPPTCPDCLVPTKRVPSRFSWKWFNKMTADGEGFTTKHVRNEDMAETMRG